MPDSDMVKKTEQTEKGGKKKKENELRNNGSQKPQPGTASLQLKNKPQHDDTPKDVFLSPRAASVLRWRLTLRSHRVGVFTQPANMT